MLLDGKPELMLSARGVVLLALCGWKGEGLEASRGAMRRYCEYISLHGFHGGASAAMAALEAMSTDDAKRWVKLTFNEYVSDKDAVIQYMMDRG